MRQTLTKLLYVVAAIVISGCSTLDQPNNPEVVDGEMVVNFPQELMKETLISKGIIEKNGTAFGYIAYAIPYTTTDESGKEVKVSGLMTVPDGMPEAVSTQIGYSIVSDDHGTIFANIDAPTVFASSQNKPGGSAIIFTSMAGFVTLQPDYIGFGDSSDHYHPFILRKSLANATVDFIKAAKSFAIKNGIKLNGQVFVTGYSEGGYAAMATLQKIEADGEMTVDLTAPMAGPYALDPMAMGVLSKPKLSVPSFMANVAYAYAKTYNKPIAEIINEPYASMLDKLFNGENNRTEIDPKLTQTTTGIDGLFVQEFVTDFSQNPDNWFKKAVVENNLHTWLPKSSVSLIHCIGDDVIPYAISELTKGTMNHMAGLMGVSVDVSLVPVEVALTGDPATKLRYGHAECAPKAYGVAAKLFGKIRKIKMGY